MAALSFRALFLAALLALLVPYCSAFRYSKSEYGSVEMSEEQDIYSAEAGVMVEDDKSEAGEVGPGLTAISQDQLMIWTTGPR